MRRTEHTIPRLAPLVALLLLVALLGFGCGPRKSIEGLKSQDILSTPNLLVEADSAWQDNRYEVSELYYAEALKRQDLVRSELPVVYSRLAKSALKNDHPQQARLALEEWANLDSSALEQLDWELPYVEAMGALGKTERLHNHLDWVRESKKTPYETKQAVALWYSEYFLGREDPQAALKVLSDFYQLTDVVSERSAFEHEMLQRLEEYDPEQVEQLATAVTSANQWFFPYALVVFERDVRMADDSETWSVAWRSLRNLTTNANLADMIPLSTKLVELEARYGVPRAGIALVLPVTGPYAKVGVKIVRGAGLAQWLLAQQGIEVDLKVINTEAAGWQKRLAELPSHYSVVGGPLRVEAFKAMHDAIGTDLLKQRATFAFLPSLGDLAEGQDAWRFFTSREDEVRSLVSLAVDQLGITDLAVLYPEENFGRAMVQTFYQQATPLGGHIKGMQSYPPRDFKQWGRRVGKLLNVPDDFNDNKDVPLEMPDFGAVFIPDGWKQAQAMLPNFFFFEGEQLVFLGPGLWSRALDSNKDIDEHYYRLAVCPGAWWDESEGGRELQARLSKEGLGQADFWVSIGYDFARFAGRLGVLPADWTASDVNRRIRSAQTMDFSMAPLTWDENGVASQDLFLFSPVRNGKQLVDAEQIKARVERAKARREKRMEAYEERMKEQQ